MQKLDDLQFGLVPASTLQMQFKVITYLFETRKCFMERSVSYYYYYSMLDIVIPHAMGGPRHFTWRVFFLYI